MVASYLCKKLGDSEAQCRRHTTYSKMSETEIIPADVGWNRMMSKEEELREWVDKIVKKGELGAVGDAPPDLLQELGLTEEDMRVEGDVEEDTCMGGLEVVEDVDEDDGFLDNDIIEEPIDLEDAMELEQEDVHLASPPTPPMPVTIEAAPMSPAPPAEEPESSLVPIGLSDFDDVVVEELPVQPESLPPTHCPATPPSPPHPTTGVHMDSDSDDDVPLTDRNRVAAKKWVEHNKINKKLDSTVESYVTRVTNLLAGGAADRRVLRSKKAESPAGHLDPILVAAEARIYYNKIMHIFTKRPTKILKHMDYPALGRYYLLFWHDVGYADQDIEEWKPSDFALQFEGLVEEYRKVHACTYIHCM